MNDHQSSTTVPGNVPAPKPRQRLRMQPLATDMFTTLVYVGIALLLFGEFIALFWLDLFS